MGRPNSDPRTPSCNFLEEPIAHWGGVSFPAFGIFEAA